MPQRGYRHCALAAIIWSSMQHTCTIVVALAMSAGPQQRTVLVTGGAGYIGSHTCLELLKIPDQQYKVVVVDNLDNSSEESLNRVRELIGEGNNDECDDEDKHSRIQFRNCDVRDRDGLNKGEHVYSQNAAGVKIQAPPMLSFPLQFHDLRISTFSMNFHKLYTCNKF